jgi:hypothetical protein
MAVLLKLFINLRHILVIERMKKQYLVLFFLISVMLVNAQEEDNLDYYFNDGTDKKNEISVDLIRLIAQPALQIYYSRTINHFAIGVSYFSLFEDEVYEIPFTEYDFNYAVFHKDKPGFGFNTTYNYYTRNNYRMEVGLGYSFTSYDSAKTNDFYVSETIFTKQFSNWLKISSEIQFGVRFVRQSMVRFANDPNFLLSYPLPPERMTVFYFHIPVKIGIVF